VIHNFKIDG
jgi:hypothetical protein